MRGIRCPAPASKAPSSPTFMSPTCHSDTTFAGRSPQTARNNAKNRQKRSWRALRVLPRRKVVHRRRAVDRRAGRKRRVNRRHPQRPNGGSPAAGRHVWARSAFSTRPSDGTHFSARHSRSISWPNSYDCHSQRSSFARERRCEVEEDGWTYGNACAGSSASSRSSSSRALAESNRRRRGRNTVVFFQTTRARRRTERLTDVLVFRAALRNKSLRPKYFHSEVQSTPRRPN